MPLDVALKLYAAVGVLYSARNLFHPKLAPHWRAAWIGSQFRPYGRARFFLEILGGVLLACVLWPIVATLELAARIAGALAPKE